MITYSAAQAISPAIERTRQFLFHPFRLGRFLKLTLVAILTEGGISSCNFGSSFPPGKSGGSSAPHSTPHLHLPVMHGPAIPIIIGFAIVVSLVMIAASIVIGYFLTRLRFSYFDCVLRMQDRITPPWRRYHRQAMRYLGLSLSLELAFWLVLIPIGFAIYEHFKPLFLSIGSDNPPTFPDFLPVIGVFAPIGLLLALAAYLVHTTLSCFVLPQMALDDAPIGDAVSDVWSDIRDDFGSFAFFFFMRFLLSLAATIVGMLALFISLVVVAAIGGIIVVFLKAISNVLAILLGVPLAILVLGLFVVALIGLGGTIGTFIRNYGLLFYGGRYPLLGDILQPPLPPMQQVPPQEIGL